MSVIRFGEIAVVIPFVAAVKEVEETLDFQGSSKFYKFEVLTSGGPTVVVVGKTKEEVEEYRSLLFKMMDEYWRKYGTG